MKMMNRIISTNEITIKLLNMFFESGTTPFQKTFCETVKSLECDIPAKIFNKLLISEKLFLMLLAMGCVFASANNAEFQKMHKDIESVSDDDRNSFLLEYYLIFLRLTLANTTPLICREEISEILSKINTKERLPLSFIDVKCETGNNSLNFREYITLLNESINDFRVSFTEVKELCELGLPEESVSRLVFSNANLMGFIQICLMLIEEL